MMTRKRIMAVVLCTLLTACSIPLPALTALEVF